MLLSVIKLLLTENTFELSSIFLLVFFNWLWIDVTFSNVDFCNSYNARICLPCLTSIASMDLVSRVLSRRLVPVGLLLGAISLIFSSITGVELGMDRSWKRPVLDRSWDRSSRSSVRNLRTGPDRSLYIIFGFFIDNIQEIKKYFPIGITDSEMHIRFRSEPPECIFIISCIKYQKIYIRTGPGPVLGLTYIRS